MTQAITPMKPVEPMTENRIRAQERLQNLLRMDEPRKGKLVTLEGPERSGKTTQIQELHRWLTQTLSGERILEALEADEVVVTKEPGATTLGQHLRQILLHEEELEIDRLAELLLFAADRAQHYADVIRPALSKGHLVLCDRYVHSTIAYQGAGRQMNRHLVKQVAMLACENTFPDLTLFLDISPQTTAKRSLIAEAMPDRLEGERIEFHSRVRNEFLQLARSTIYGVLIDAEQPEPEVQDEIRNVFADQVRAWVEPEKTLGVIQC